jgi:hypothetical protein
MIVVTTDMNIGDAEVAGRGSQEGVHLWADRGREGWTTTPRRKNDMKVNRCVRVHGVGPCGKSLWEWYLGCDGVGAAAFAAAIRCVMPRAPRAKPGARFDGAPSRAHAACVVGRRAFAASCTWRSTASIRRRGAHSIRRLVQQVGARRRAVQPGVDSTARLRSPTPHVSLDGRHSQPAAHAFDRQAFAGRAHMHSTVSAASATSWRARRRAVQSSPGLRPGMRGVPAFCGCEGSRYKRSDRDALFNSANSSASCAAW